eukprot:TRINITY_DN15850_c0_g1_i1.p1 TRINITY_DN15850_c0_g1~~TRINITY_DN15850_c0_g1_i1.p1  ORF type:complete len:340 (-),score=58.55 TRINITY_DN15850_c0_g1_i1:126-1088(-)
MEVLTAGAAGLQQFITNFDGRKAHWVQTHSWQFPVVALSLYLLMVYLGPRWMKNRDEFKLNGFLKWWNFFLFVFSAAMFVPWAYATISFTITKGYFEMVCMPHSELMFGYPCFVGWLFALSKYIELVDTLLLILRKRPVMFLHWYHHFSVLAFTWFNVVVLLPIGQLFGTVNAGIHTVMYWYYFLAACGQRPTWGKAVTIAQLTQMGIGLVFSASWGYWRYHGEACPLNKGDANAVFIMCLIIYGSYFILFLRFFMKRHGAVVHQAKPASSGDTTVSAGVSAASSAVNAAAEPDATSSSHTAQVDATPVRRSSRRPKATQ